MHQSSLSIAKQISDDIENNKVHQKAKDLFSSRIIFFHRPTKIKIQKLAFYLEQQLPNINIIAINTKTTHSCITYYKVEIQFTI